MKTTKVYSCGIIEIDGQDVGEINWIKLHKEMVGYNANETICIEKDGTINNIGSNSSPSPEYAKNIIATLTTWGRGNMDTTPYSDNWTEYDKESDTYTTEDGRVLTEDEMIDECIEEGEWIDQIDMWVEEINSQIEESENE